MTIVTYNSVYGSTKQYATELARRLGTTPIELDDAPAALAAHPHEAIVVCSPTYGPVVAGAQFIKDTNLQGRAVALVVVGMTLSEHARDKDAAAGLLGAAAATTTRFYLPGRLNHSTLSRVHKGVLWSLHKLLKGKPNRTANEENMVKTYGQDIDRVDLAELDPVVQWAQAAST